MQKHATRIYGQKAITLLLISTMLLLLYFSKEVAYSVRDAIGLCVNILLPSLFPFMVLSDLLVRATKDATPPAWLSRLTEALLGIPAICLLPFVLGALCGFPIGVKSATSLYRERRISPRAYANALCFVNNTGPAFLVGAVGVGMLSSSRIGYILYAVQLVAALLTGLIFARIPYENAPPAATDAQESGTLAAIILQSVRACLLICGLTLLFAALHALLVQFLGTSPLLPFLLAFLEVGNATANAATLYASQVRTALLLLMLAVSFGGVSVHMQALSFMPRDRGLFVRYLAAKLTQAAIACLLILFLR